MTFFIALILIRIQKNIYCFRANIAKEHLATYLIALCKYFYEQGSKGELLPGSTYTSDHMEPHEDVEKKYVYQCSHCLTVYEEEEGEPENGIPPGIYLAHYHPPIAALCAKLLKMILRK